MKKRRIHFKDLTKGTMFMYTDDDLTDVMLYARGEGRYWVVNLNDGSVVSAASILQQTVVEVAR